MKKLSLSSLLVLAAALALTGCGRPFDVKTAPGLVELDDQEPEYSYRAIAPERVVMAVRVVDTKGAATSSSGRAPPRCACTSSTGTRSSEPPT